MVPPVTRAVRFLSTVQSIKRDPVQSISSFSKEHFPKFLAFTAVFGFASGFLFMEFATRPTIVSSSLSTNCSVETKICDSYVTNEWLLFLSLTHLADQGRHGTEVA